MNQLSQRDYRWRNKQLGSCSGFTIGGYGCLITALAMLADKRPDEVNNILSTGGGYSSGCLVNNNAAKLLDLPFSTVRDRVIKYPTIAETAHYAPKYPQHFFIVLDENTAIDPLDGKIKAPYKIKSYRNYTNKTIAMSKGAVHKNALWIGDDINEYHHVANKASEKFLRNLGVEFTDKEVKTGDWSFDVEWLHNKAKTEQDIVELIKRVSEEKESNTFLREQLKKKPKEVIVEVKVSRADLDTKGLIRELWKRFADWFNESLSRISNK